VKPAPKAPTPVAKAPTPVAKAPAPVAAKPQPRPRPTHEQIARRAYEIYAGRGCSHGDHMQDWLQAERELTQK